MHLLKLPHQAAVLQEHFVNCTATILQQLVDNAILCRVAGLACS
jgi:hypothetical protein